MSFFGDLMSGSAQKKASNYNASLLERNAKLEEQQAEREYQIYEQYDLPRFNYFANRQQSTIKNQLAGSGVEIGSGTALDIVIENQNMIDTDRDMMAYNAEIAKDRKLNQAVMSRASANVERFRGRVAKRASYFRAASSLLTDASRIGVI